MTSDKMNKTRRVEVETARPAPQVRQAARRRTVCHAHDEANQSHVGDIVEIMETRPLSKLKRWRIVRIVRPGAQQALAGEGEAAKPPARACARAEAAVDAGSSGCRGPSPPRRRCRDCRPRRAADSRPYRGVVP